MAEQETSKAAPDEGIPEKVGTSLMDVPDTVIQGAYPEEEAAPLAAAEPEPVEAAEAAAVKPGAEPEKETPPEGKKPEEKEPEAEPQAETEPPVEGAPAEEGFDPAAWAEANNIPADLVKSCKTGLEVAGAVARRLRNREVLDGRKDAELAELRSRLGKETPGAAPAEKSPADTAAPASEPAPRTEQEVQAEWTAEQRERFREWQEESPELAGAWMVRQQMDPVIAAIREENRRSMAAIRNEMKTHQEAPREAELEKEYSDFMAAHPEDYDTFTAVEMPILAEALGLPATSDNGRPIDVGRVTGTKLEDLYAMAQMRKTSPRMFGQVVRDMRGGMEFERARRVAQLEQGEKGQAEQAGQRASAQVRTAKGAAAAPAGAGAGPPRPVARTLRDLPLETFEG